MTMEKEKLEGWNERNNSIFCSIEADDDTVDSLDDDTNSFNHEYSLLYTLVHLRLRMKKIEYHMIIFPAFC